MLLVLIAAVPIAHPDNSSYLPDEKKTPATCDDRTLAQHLDAARSTIERAYKRSRWRDPTPATQQNKRRWRSHRRCIRHDYSRRQIGRWVDRAQERFARYRQERLWRARLTPPGPEWLAALRWCESTNNYRANTGNGFYGGYQFTLSTWQSVGGSGYPHLASPAEQDYRAAVLYRTGGPGHWPNCP